MIDAVERMKKEGFRRRLSTRTIKSYVFWVEKFLNFTKKDIKKLKKEDVRVFIEYLSEKKCSGSTLNVAYSAVRFLVKEILYKRWNMHLKCSKTAKTLPVFLTKEEIRDVLSSIDNVKHRLIVSLMYSAGLRVSELVHLKVRDLEISGGYGWVRQGKGNKDRLFIVADKLKQDIADWINLNNLRFDSYLFEGHNGHITSRTVAEIVKKAADKARIKKNVHPHTFRHSFGTHVMEKGNKVGDLQRLMGHKDPNTTLTYVHTAKSIDIGVTSPFDTL